MDLGVPIQPRRDLGVIAPDLTRVATGEASAQELIAERVERAHRIQPVTNAFISIPDDPEAGAGPLSGIAVAVKDLIDQHGVPTTAGSSFLRDPASGTAPCLARLETAGVTLLGRTNLHEFAFGFSSENDWYGPVRNPIDPTTSAGGSSGGSAAAVAAGVVDVAIGTDTGGSVRVPAALCGVVGLKVTHGAIDTSGVFPLAPTLDTVGPIGATVSDVAIVHSVLTGSLSPAAPSGTDLTRLRVGVPHPWIGHPTASRVRAAFRRALDRMADLGIEIVDLDLPDLEPSSELAIGAYFEVAEVHRRWFTAEPDRYGPGIRSRIAATLDVTVADYRAALDWRARIGNSATRAFDSVDVLATPTVGAMRKALGEDTITIDGTDHHYRAVLSQFTALVNHLGLPALAMPLASNGSPPPSLQLIGSSGSERELLAIGTELERVGIISGDSRSHG
ncbi:MAG: amidase [Acidimicrobiia bacterium]|nr:amidase [Acidimicrobiia bacterium]